jgi:TonB family protein
LPEPFLEIARHCLLQRAEGRWSVAQIAGRLSERIPVHQFQAIPPKVRAPSPAPSGRPIRQPLLPPIKLPKYAMPIAIAGVLVLIAILAGPKLLRHGTDSPHVASATAEQPVLSPAPSPVAAPMKNSTKAYSASAADEQRSSKTPVPVPALLHPGTMQEEETNAVARMPVGSIVHGDVAHQAMPEVLQSARNSIRGKLKVSVKVNVDRSGNVEDAELESRGPSKYFARAALAAAQDWKFKPATVDGRGVLSTWILRFEFTRGGTSVVPRQEMP